MKTATSNRKKSTREIILHTIQTAQHVNVEALAKAADVSPVTVRHHLNSLQAGGLIEASSVRRKVGRPYYVYSLSEKGQELFPKRYVRLTNRLLDELKARLPAEAVQAVFSSVVQGVIEDHAGRFEHLSFEERLNYLVDLLTEEGFVSEWEQTADGYKITEYGCPYLTIGRSHAEICSFDYELMVNVLQTTVQKQSCMLAGADCCEFIITPEISQANLSKT